MNKIIKTKDGKEYSNYKDYLLSSHWAKVKNEYKKKFPYKCSMCESKYNLHLHHTTYERIGKEDLNDLVCLCKSCHDLIHKVKKGTDLSGVNKVLSDSRNSKNEVYDPKKKKSKKTENKNLDTSLEFYYNKSSEKNKRKNRR